MTMDFRTMEDALRYAEVLALNPEDGSEYWRSRLPTLTRGADRA